jgi:transcription factor E2F7/8
LSLNLVYSFYDRQHL